MSKIDMKEASVDSNTDPYKRTTSPTVTGTTVLALKYKDGVMMLADTLGSYGSMCRFTELDRIRKVNDKIIVGGGGEWSDFQFICRLLQELNTNDIEQDDGHVLSAAEINSYLSRVLYNRRSRINPLWNQIITAGYEEGKSFLGFVDLYGSCYTDNYIATGFGAYLGIGIIRKYWRADMDEKEARALIESAMLVCLYRDCFSLNKFTLATITKEGARITEPYPLKTYWEYKAAIDPDASL